MEVKQYIFDFMKERNENPNQISAKLNMHLESYDNSEKKITCSFPVQNWEMNVHGGMHGGMLAAAADAAMACVSYAYSEGKRGVTVSLSMTYSSSIQEGDTLIIDAYGDHIGRKITQIRAIMTSRLTGKKIASAIASYSFIEKGERK